MSQYCKKFTKFTFSVKYGQIFEFHMHHIGMNKKSTNKSVVDLSI